MLGRKPSTQRTLPHSHDAETAVIGGLMLDDQAFSKVSDWLQPDDFYVGTHATIYRAIADLVAQGKPYDPVTMAEWFEANGVAGEVDAGKILSIANSTASAANILSWADIVKEKSRLRQLIDIGTNTASAAFEARTKASDIASASSSQIGALVMDPRAGGLSEVRTAVGAFFGELHERYERKAELTGLETPWAELNEKMLGWQPGDLTIIAARPGSGKSIMAFQAAAHNAILMRNATAVFSLEMRSAQFVQRTVASLGAINYRHLRKPKDIANEEWPAITKTLSDISNSPIFIDDQPRLNAKQIEARAKRQHLRTPLKMILVDHLHEMKLPGRNEVAELGEEGRALRAVGKELGVPVILLAQLNRGSTKRSDGRPTREDIRGSGSIEEVADIILIVHPHCGVDGAAEIIIDKAREFEPGSFFVKADYQRMRFENWDGTPPKRERAKAKSKGLDIEPRPAPTEVDL